MTEPEGAAILRASSLDELREWGEWAPRESCEPDYGTKVAPMLLDGSRCIHGNSLTTYLFRVGKKRAGRMLDGREHSAFPE